MQPPESLLGHLKIFPSMCYMGAFGFQLIMDVYFFGLLAGRLEEEKLGTFYHDYLWMLVYVFVACNLVEYILCWNSYYILANSFSMALYYIFSKKNPNEKIFLFFIFSVKASYFPWAITALAFLQGASVWSELVGIAIGHSFIYLSIICEVSYGKNYLKTPNWFKNLYGRICAKINNTTFGGAQRVEDQPGNQFRAFQGRGVRLG